MTCNGECVYTKRLQERIAKDQVKLKEKDKALASAQQIINSLNMLYVQTLSSHTHRIDELELLVADLRDKNALLTAQTNRNSENSSIPSSQDRFRKPVPNSREKTGRKAGGQKGHPRHKLERKEPTEPMVYLQPDPEILQSGEWEKTGRQIIRQCIDLDITPKVTDYCAEEYRNRQTGKLYNPNFPKGLRDTVNYGPLLKAFLFSLNNYGCMSIDKIRQFVSDITGGAIFPSKGFINDLLKEFSDITMPEYNAIAAQLHASHVLHVDSTTGKVNGSYHGVMITASEKATHYALTQHKGHKGVAETPLAGYDGIVIHDHELTYYAYGHAHQECLAHISRYLKGTAENEPDAVWASDMRSLITEMVDTYNRNGRFVSKERADVFLARYDGIIEQGRQHYRENEPGRYYRDGYNLWKRLHEFKDSVLYFLNHPGVETDNNLAERAARKYKRKQVAAGTFRSAELGGAFCRALTIMETGRQNGKTIWGTIYGAFVRTMELAPQICEL